MMAVSPSPTSGLSVEIRLVDQNKPGLDVKKMKKELHRMKMELIGALDNCGIEGTMNQKLYRFHAYNFDQFFFNNEDYEDLLQRDGSVRGRSLHVMSTVRHLANRSQWKRDYVAEESGKVVLYITSCQDLHRDLIFESLPMIFVNGRYFGNDATLMQQNESRSLSGTLRDFHGRSDCSSCGGVGYTICVKCGGGKKSSETYSVRLKCATCNSDGITPCLGCGPKSRKE
ncbi:hypothetical protein PRIPAC_93219 [Pristionchus pacificus]|uniref:Uncharacterized protein n=1 Tax=Pristionchus pacificus TaxID=54126 RepID=A0A2A6BQV0_PRIPA|nr:hypothetical protein PRIPAC_93219 [Pristionchus pacificus]|eukprot:PDM68163.1 hypothetical protein PRIPAC_46207 [Pristionchus pacificus]